ncbi:hypothetical protein [Rhizobium sp. FY34]|nr:hypothetical protein [Rhizobium sp. FY34]
MQKARARAIAVAQTTSTAKLRLFVLAACVTAALLALPGIF